MRAINFDDGFTAEFEPTVDQFASSMAVEPVGNLASDNCQDALEELQGDIDTINSGHVANTSNPHSVTKTQVGLGNVTNDAQVTLAQKGAANGVAELDSDGKVPFGQSLVQSVAGKNGAVTLDQSDVGLDQVDNTSDLNKPVSTDQQDALDALQTLLEGDISDVDGDLTDHVTDTANPHSVTKTQVGLDQVDNTSDATKNSASATLTNKTITSPVIDDYMDVNEETAPSAPGAGKVRVYAKTGSKLYYKVSGGTEYEVADTASALTNPMDDIGQLIYGTTAGAVAKLAAGTLGQFLVSGGAAIPTWTNTIPNALIVARDVSSGANSVMTASVYGSSGAANGTLNLISGRGTIASPTATQSGDVLGQITWRGVDNAPAVTGAAAALTVTATQTFTTTAQGTKVGISTTANGASTATLRLEIGQDGIGTWTNGIKLPSSGATATTLDFNADVTASIAVSGPFTSTNFTFRFVRVGKMVVVTWPQVLAAGNNSAAPLTLSQTNWPSWARPVSAGVNAAVFVRANGSNLAYPGHFNIPGSGDPTVNMQYNVVNFTASNATTVGMEAGHLAFSVL